MRQAGQARAAGRKARSAMPLPHGAKPVRPDRRPLPRKGRAALALSLIHISFKTFTLLAALNEGVSPETNLNCAGHVNINGWQVENYGGTDYGTRSIRSAFAVSSNTGFALSLIHI